MWNRYATYCVRKHWHIEVPVDTSAGAIRVLLDKIDHRIRYAGPRCRLLETMPKGVLRRLSRIVEALLPDPLGQMVRRALAGVESRILPRTVTVEQRPPPLPHTKPKQRSGWLAFRCSAALDLDACPAPEPVWQPVDMRSRHEAGHQQEEQVATTRRISPGGASSSAQSYQSGSSYRRGSLSSKADTLHHGERTCL